MNHSLSLSLPPITSTEQHTHSWNRNLYLRSTLRHEIIALHLISSPSTPSVTNQFQSPSIPSITTSQSLPIVLAASQFPAVSSSNPRIDSYTTWPLCSIDVHWTMLPNSSTVRIDWMYWNQCALPLISSSAISSFALCPFSPFSVSPSPSSVAASP